MPGPGSNKPAIAKPKNAGKTLKRIMSYMSEYKLKLIFVAMAIVISSGAGVAGTYFLKPIINKYIVPFIGQQDPDLSGFIGIITIMGILYLSGIAATYAYNRLMIDVSTGTLYRIRVDLFKHMEDLPIKYFDTHTHGELMSRFTNDTDSLREMFSQGLPNLFSSFLTVVGVFVMMLILSPALTMLVILMLALMLFSIGKIGAKSAMYFRKQQKEIGKVNGYIEEMIEGQKVVKVFSHQAVVSEEFSRLNEELCKAATGANTFANILMPIMGNLSYVNYALTAAAGGVMAINGRMDIGTIASFLQYTRSFSQPITQISQQFNSILNALAGAERIFDIIDEKPEVDDGSVELVNVKRNSAGGWEESEASTGKWAWKQLDKSGNLIYTEVKGDVSFYDVPDGKIQYDGININKIRKSDLRRSLSMVLQDTHLFTGTVMENIRYGRLDASDEDVVKAAKLANAHSFIKHLPQGYDTMLTSDGANLSQGQRQLLAIARAAVANPPVLVLDEATSSIDTRTEALIEKGMDTLMEGRTVFVIAHRLSTVRNSNAIMVFENGRIIERGNHEDLIAEQGKYYQLYTGMFELA
ncbi:MAG TPA: ABC transporter ATP-binding protein [Negativicutes bacterium]|nr:ABC transporter ATP-binding protein [Negativicutes bacterium]